MTSEEKREAIIKHCETVEDCETCPLYYKSGPCFKSNVDENYDLLFKDGEITQEVILPANDPVNRPSHYTDGKIEVIDFIEDKKLGFCLGNAIKYIARAGKKDPTKEIQDLQKARWYVERRIKELEEGA